jgi:hypothetical protein
MSDEKFIENIRKIVFNYDNWMQAKRLVKEGKLEYVIGFHCGYFRACK